MEEGQTPSLGTSSESERISRETIEYAFEILGPVCKQGVFQHLKEAYGTDIWSATQSNLGEIRRAIADLFGDAAANLIMKPLCIKIELIKTAS